MSKFKVGEECKFQGNKLVITAVGENTVLARNPILVEELAIPISQLMPLKTPAEIKRAKDFIALSNIINEWKETPHKSSTRLSNWILDSQWFGGYRKQQVKPLSKSYALQEIGLNDYGYKFMVDQGFIVQGGE
jgi:hypothetical protein